MSIKHKPQCINAAIMDIMAENCVGLFKTLSLYLPERTRRNFRSVTSSNQTTSVFDIISIKSIIIYFNESFAIS
jgi:hypothetical protein